MLNGDITPQQMLDIPINGMYEFFQLVGRGRGNWFTGGGEKTRHVNKQTLEKFKEWIENPVDKSGRSIASWTRVRDVMPPEVVAQCLMQSDKLDTNVKKYKKTKREKRVEKETYVLGYEELYAVAIAEYNKGNFEVAAQKYEEMIQKYPDNALLRNDLAATYNRLGRYQDAIVQAREIVKRIGDKSQYGAAQYNAGFAYEQLGDLEKARANYKLAVANGNARVKKDLERVTRALESKTGTKKVAFDDAAGRVQKSGRTVDFLAYVMAMQETNSDKA
jgi:tetratricopeptide (TPR) repeat protein